VKRNDSEELEMNGTEGELAVYVHLPFCVRKCLYCDFISGVYEKSIQKSYVNKLLWEIEEFFEREYPVKKPVIKSVFFGGGTPSVLPAEEIGRILCKLKEYGEFTDTEITVEVNPGTVDAVDSYEKTEVVVTESLAGETAKEKNKRDNKLEEYKRMGINRLSIGMQSTCDGELKSLGRIHNYEEFLKTFRLAREAGFENINVDVMYAIPGQDFASFENTLRKTAESGPEHISAYSLIVEEGTPFAEMKLNLPSEEEERRMYASVERILGEYGYHQYEISNYAKEGRECRHNKAYWTGKEYAGFGVAAASFLYKKREGNSYPDFRYTNTESVEAYLNAETYEDLKNIRREEEILSKEEQMAEFVILGLRMNRGVKREDFYKVFGKEPEEVFAEPIRKHVKDGLLLINENGDLVLSKRGFDLANIVMADFL